MTNLSDGTYLSVQGFIIKSDSQNGKADFERFLEEENFSIEGEVKSITSDSLMSDLNILKADVDKRLKEVVLDTELEIIDQIKLLVNAENRQILDKVLTYPEYISEVFISELEALLLK